MRDKSTVSRYPERNVQRTHAEEEEEEAHAYL